MWPNFMENVIDICQLWDDSDIAMTKDFNPGIITMLHEIKGNPLEMNEKIDILSRKI